MEEDPAVMDTGNALRTMTETIMHMGQALDTQAAPIPIDLVTNDESLTAMTTAMGMMILAPNVQVVLVSMADRVVRALLGAYNLFQWSHC